MTAPCVGRPNARYLGGTKARREGRVEYSSVGVQPLTEPLPHPPVPAGVQLYISLALLVKLQNTQTHSLSAPGARAQLTCHRAQGLHMEARAKLLKRGDGGAVGSSGVAGTGAGAGVGEVTEEGVGMWGAVTRSEVGAVTGAVTVAGADPGASPGAAAGSAFEGAAPGGASAAGAMLAVAAGAGGYPPEGPGWHGHPPEGAEADADDAAPSELLAPLLEVGRCRLNRRHPC